MQVKKVCKDILDYWTGPLGLCWCDEKKQYVKPDSCKECPECEAIDDTDIHPPKYIRPKDITW
jgi:hypothetical protein